jgi:hypothetical protein
MAGPACCAIDRTGTKKADTPATARIEIFFKNAIVLVFVICLKKASFDLLHPMCWNQIAEQVHMAAEDVRRPQEGDRQRNLRISTVCRSER